jgi:SAM-dependent methyltransferase
MNKSVEFGWDANDFEDLLRSCEKDDAINITLEYLNRDDKILEAGAGSGRVVKYLSVLGYKGVEGIELNEMAVNDFNRRYPDIKMIKGDILQMPYPEIFFDVVVSYGVVEHFKELGVVPPLIALRSVLKCGGLAIITIPSHNYVRRVMGFVYMIGNMMNPKKNALFRKLMGKPSIQRQHSSGFGYYVYPQGGEFFEYRLTPFQFTAACEQAGFSILKSMPVAHMDGIYHLFGEKLVIFSNWEFKPSAIAKFLNHAFKVIPFFHSHMHLVVLKK